MVHRHDPPHTAFRPIAWIDSEFGDYRVHEYIVVRRRNLWKELALKRQRDQRHVEAGVLEPQFVVSSNLP